MFTQSFGTFVCPGHRITCTVDRFTATATVYRDDCGDRPDQRQDGFWPSRDPQAAGFVQPENFEVEQAVWGIECNYPDSDNAYLSEVANVLLSDAIEQAKAKLATLCQG